MRSSSDGPRPSPLAVLGMAAAIALAWCSGLVARHETVSLRGGPHSGDYLVVTGICLATASALALALVAVVVLRAPWFVWVAGVAATGHHAALAVSAYQLSRTTAPDPQFPGGSVVDGVVDAALLPGTWPLFVVVAAAVVALARSAPTRGVRSPGRLVVIGVSVAFVLAALSGPAAWYFHLHFFTLERVPVDYQSVIIPAGATVGLLLVGALVIRVVRGTRYQLLPAGFGVLLQVLVALSCLEGALATPRPGDHYDVEIRGALETVALLPTTWPLLVVLAWVVLTSTPGTPRGGSGAGRVDPWSHRPRPLEADAS